MKRGWFRRHLGHLIVAGGLLSICAGLGAACFYFYYLGPLRRTLTSSWHERHTEKGRWLEVQKSIARGVWPHDTFHYVGRYGDEEWARRVMERMGPADRRSCRTEHRVDAMRTIANRGFSVGAECMAWWDENKTRPQETWIREGFAEYGVDLQTPLTTDNTIALLKLVGSFDLSKKDPPKYIHYNAFRWLRDSDFDAGDFPVGDVPREELAAVVKGLVKYAAMEAEAPKRHLLGVLELGEPASPLSVVLVINSPSLDFHSTKIT
jgi:hypothetical protein